MLLQKNSENKKESALEKEKFSAKIQELKIKMEQKSKENQGLLNYVTKYSSELN